MGRARKGTLMDKEDQLIELPDGILSIMISFVPLKEAIRTSVLSKRWRYIWTCHSKLCFDSINILGMRVDYNSVSNYQSLLDRQIRRGMFIERVNHFMQHRCKGPKIDYFSLHCHLGKESASYIDQWIRDAAIKEVEYIDLDLSEWCTFRMDQCSFTAYEQYEFSCWTLSTSIKCTIKNLKLASCILNPIPSPNKLISLKTVELKDVNVNDQQLSTFLSICPQLEVLSLVVCNDLVNLKLDVSCHNLKVLSIRDCSRMETIDIYAENLVVFEYTGEVVSFSFKYAPMLAEGYLSFTGEHRLDGLTYALTKFANSVPSLQTLNLLSILAMKVLKLPEIIHTSPNLKCLVLSIFPFDDEDKLYWLSYIFEAFPLLQKLQLNLFSPNFIRKQKGIERLLPDCPHKHLTEVEINGFYGNEHEIELLTYLLKNVVELKVLVVTSHQKVHRGVNKWVQEEGSSRYKLRLESVREWLLSVVPKTIHLKVH